MVRSLPSSRMLLLCLVAALLLLSPFLAHYEPLHAAFDAALYLVILGALRDSRVSRHELILCAAVGAAWIGLSGAIYLVDDDQSLRIAYAVCSSIFYFLTVALVLRGILAEREVSLDAIAGAVAAYMLLAMLFGALFASLQLVAPGSFVRAFPPGELHPATWPELMYLSFTALTPLKGGHVEAVSSWANVLLVLEAFLGVFYLALLVSRLVRLYQARDQAR